MTLDRFFLKSCYKERLLIISARHLYGSRVSATLQPNWELLIIYIINVASIKECDEQTSEPLIHSQPVTELDYVSIGHDEPTENEAPNRLCMSEPVDHGKNLKIFVKPISFYLKSPNIKLYPC